MLTGREEEEFRKIMDALASSDPKLVELARPSRWRTGVGVLAVLAGMLALIVSVSVNLPIIGIAGFLVALTGATLTYQALTRRPFASDAGSTDVPATARASAVGTWAERRWRNRQGRD